MTRLRNLIRAVKSARHLPLLALLVLTAAQAVAAPEPDFLIETITVEGLRKFPPGIIIAKSLLVEGETYNEAELRDANNRVIRLPLILDAEFELRKGTARGKYELVIKVTEARRWFFGLGSRYSFWADPISVSGLDTSSNTEADNFLAGYRVPVGGDGLFFVTLGGADGTLSLGYTQYDLFSRSVIMSLKVAWSDCADVRETSESNQLGEDGCATEIFDLGLDPTYSTWTLRGDNFRGRFNLGIPLRGNQSVRWLSTYRLVKSGLRRPAYRPSLRSAYLFENEQEIDTSLAWVLNTEDDSILPSRGKFIESGLSYRGLQAEMASLLAPAEGFDLDSKELRAYISGRRHWPMSRKTTLSVGVNAHLGRSRIRNVPLENGDIVSDDLNVWGGGASLQHGWFLWQVYNGQPKHPWRRPRWREMRWENRIEVLFGGTSPSFDQLENPLRGFQISSGLVFRNTWGVFRIQLSYVDVRGK